MTETSRWESAPRVAESRLTAILDAALDAYIMIDGTGIIIEWNAQAERTFGWTATEVLGRRVADTIVPRSYRGAHEQGLLRFLAMGPGSFVNRRVEITACHRDGHEFPVELAVAPIREGSGWLFSAFLRDITERKQTDEELFRSNQLLRELSQRLRSVREAERAQISRRIHDDLGQGLTALRMDLDWLESRMSPGRAELRSKCQSMGTLVETMIGRVRYLAAELRPAVLDDLGLVAAAEWEVEQFSRRTGIRCTVDLPAEGPRLDGDRSTDLFRILQEALTNVARHAAARRVEVRLWATLGELVLEVTDDGRGIEGIDLTSTGSLGVLGMRERAARWSGELDIQPRAGGGTVVTVRLPIARHTHEGAA